MDENFGGGSWWISRRRLPLPYKLPAVIGADFFSSDKRQPDAYPPAVFKNRRLWRLYHFFHLFPRDYGAFAERKNGNGNTVCRFERRLLPFRRFAGAGARSDVTLCFAVNFIRRKVVSHGN